MFRDTATAWGRRAVFLQGIGLDFLHARTIVGHGIKKKKKKRITSKRKNKSTQKVKGKLQRINQLAHTQIQTVTLWAKFQGLTCTSTGTQTAEVKHFRNRKKNVFWWTQRRGPSLANSPATVRFDLFLHGILEGNGGGKGNQRWKKNSKVSQKQNKQICSMHFLEIKDPTR